MYRLTNAQLTQIQHYLRFGAAEMAGYGLTYDVEGDMASWARLMRQAPGTVAVTPSFDPEQSWLHSENCFWSKLQERDGRVVACLAMRLFVTTDILDEIRSWRLFYNRKPVLDLEGLELIAPYDAPLISGRVGYSGGLWIHPEYRGKGLAVVFPRMHRAVAFRHFDLDWACALHPDTANRRAMVRESYGWAGQFSCINGFFPGRKAQGQYQLSFSSRSDVLSQIREDLDQATVQPRLDPATIAAE